MKNYGVTLTQYLDPIWRETFIHETGFVDVLNLDTAEPSKEENDNADSNPAL